MLSSLTQKLLLLSFSKLLTSGFSLNDTLLDLDVNNPIEASSSTERKVDLVVPNEISSQSMSHLIYMSMIA